MRKQVMMILLLISAVLWGQAPSTYYDDAEGLSGVSLQAALHAIIDGHDALSYTALWTAMKYTDKRADGYVWDMYSDNPDGDEAYVYTFGSDQCGNYSGEGSCYNREHSFPKSWFGDATPMYTDLFHLVPTDGYVNGKRSNYPFGEVDSDSASWTSTNGCRLGKCITEGYSGTVFEPIDEYKGDFARNYFYMATRYYGEDNSWPGSAMVDGSQPKAWALAMLKRWHNADPVSDKEIDRNNIIYKDYQHNRNPYIDHPEYVCAVWGGDCDSTYVPGDTTVIVDTTVVVYEITMQESDYQAIVDYVNAEGLPNSSTYDVSEDYYGASAHYTNYDIRSGKQNAAFASPEEAIEESILKVVLPLNFSAAVLNENYTVNYATYNGSDGTGSMVFHCTGVSPLAFASGENVTTISNASAQGVIGVYPNPATGEIALNGSVDALQIISLSGRVVLSQQDLNANETISISHLPKGVYLLHAHFGESVQIIKLVKK